MCAGTKEGSMKRTIEDSLGEFEDDDLFISRPAKRITMCHNTPKQAKDEKKKLMKTSKRKLKQMDHPESNLRRSVLVNNVYKRLQSELRQEKSNKYYGYAINPRCPFGFGAGMKEITQRKRQARLEQVLNEKCRTYEKVVINQVNDGDRCDRNNKVSENEQLLMLAESMDVQLCGAVHDNSNEGYVNITNDTHKDLCDMDSAQHQQCDNNTSHYTEDSSCDIKQTMLERNEKLGDNLCHFTHQDLSRDSDSYSGNRSLQMSPAQISHEITTSSLLSCDAIETIPDITDSLAQEETLEYDSENEEIDVCSCEDDDLPSAQQLTKTSASGLLLQQLQSAGSHISDNITNSSSLQCQASGATQWTQSSNIDFPPKAKSTADDLSLGSNNNGDYNNNSTVSDHQRVFSNAGYPVNGEDSLNSYNQLQGQLQGGYNTGLGHVVNPFCHPLFYHNLLSSSSAYYSQVYNPSLYTNSFYPSGLASQNYLQNTNSSTTHSMVTCT